MTNDGMWVKLDRTVCDGFRMCADHAPETFSLDDWGYASLTADGQVAPEHRDGVQRAILDCPVHAILELRQGQWDPPAPVEGSGGAPAPTGA
jgi:ferredoxin